MRPITMPPMTSKANDNWQTPDEALDPLVPSLNFIKRICNHHGDFVTWEPAQGKGNLTKGLIDRGFNSIGSDILTGQDFLSWTPDRFDCIVTNPPFSLKQQFLERCYRLKRPFALLMPLTTFETPGRQTLFREYGLEVIMFGYRICFENEAGTCGRPYFACAWFTNWLGLGKQLTFWQPKPAKIGLL